MAIILRQLDDLTLGEVDSIEVTDIDKMTYTELIYACQAKLREADQLANKDQLLTHHQTNILHKIKERLTTDELTVWVALEAIKKLVGTGIKQLTNACPENIELLRQALKLLETILN